jgi:hypothetical protein
VGSRTGLDDVKKRKFLPSPELELRTLGRPARSQSLYRLPYPGCPSSRCGEEKYLLPLPGTEPDSSAVQSADIAVSTVPNSLNMFLFFSFADCTGAIRLVAFISAANILNS